MEQTLELLQAQGTLRASASYTQGDHRSYPVSVEQLLDDPFKVIGECINVTDKQQKISFLLNDELVTKQITIASGVNSDEKERTFGAMIGFIAIIFAGKEKDEICEGYKPAENLKLAYEKHGIEIPVLSWKGLQAAAKLMSARKKSNCRNHVLQTYKANKPLWDDVQRLNKANRLLASQIKA